MLVGGGSWEGWEDRWIKENCKIKEYKASKATTTPDSSIGEAKQGGEGVSKGKLYI